MIFRLLSLITCSVVLSRFIQAYQIMKPSLSSASAVISVRDRKKAALIGLYVADATAMPVHWMYNLFQLQEDYGQITGYVKPKDKFRGSIMNLSNTGGGGRGSDLGDIVGNVILHGKKQYWLRGGDNHYHRGLEAGIVLHTIIARFICY